MKYLSPTLLAAFSAILLATSAADQPVEMLTDTEELQPASTLEFRFARPMISRDDVGVAVTLDKSPITIAPDIAGRFTWLSRSSGVFSPDDAWPLGGSFTIRLRENAVDADGGKLAGNFSQVLRTPSFGHTKIRGGGDKTCEPVPRIVMVFNLAVDVDSAKPVFRFVMDDGSEVAADVSHATVDHYIHVPIEHDDWLKRWQAARGLAVDDESDDEAPIPNRLLIEPARPLSPGAWRLEMKPGINSQDGNHRITGPWSLKLGTVEPFDVTKLRTDNFINSGRRVTITFSQSLAPDIIPHVAGRYFSIDPPVENLRFERRKDTLVARGDFVLDHEYRLQVGGEVISADALPFEGNRTRKFRFQPVKPRLYLPEITASQIQGGQRKFDVLSVNLSSINVTARLVDPKNLAAAVAAFANYNRDVTDYDNSESYQELAADSFQSEPIAALRIPMDDGPLDTRQITRVDWNEILGERPTGAIFLTIEGEPRQEIGGKRAAAQALIQLTDLGLMWKKTAAGLEVTAFSLETGLPVSSADVSLLDNEFNSIGTAETGADGITTLAWNEDAEWLVAQSGDDACALATGIRADQLWMNSFNVPIEYANWISFGETWSSMRAVLFTDRPLYRPGESVKVKGLLRDVSNDGMELPAAFDAKVSVRDPRGRVILTRDVTIDARGAFDLDFDSGPTGGSHMIMLELPSSPASPWGNGFSCGFEVADFQPDAFELTVNTPERFSAGESARAEVTARYLFGAPVDRADLRWTLIESREYFQPQGYDNWSFGEYDGSDRPLTLRGEGRIDDKRPFLITPQLPEAIGTPRRTRLTVELTDINQQTVSSSAVFVRDAADFHLGVALPEGRVAQVGADLPLQVIAVRPDGSPLDQPLEVHAELIRRNFETVRVKGAGNAISFRSDTVETTVSKTTGRTLLPVRENGMWHAGEGVSLGFRIEQAGSYHVRIRTNDSAGREVVHMMPIYVSGRDELAWDYRNPAEVDMVPDKEVYRPGETARLMVKAPISGEALVTIERGERILRRMRVKLEGNAPEIEVPILKDDAPNVFVSLMLVRGREDSTLKHKMPDARYGLAMLRVHQPDARLNVEVKPSATEVLPGGDLEVVVTVQNEDGGPVADAEVVLFAPDDGILAITGYERPKPERIFHAPLPLAVRTGLSLDDLLPEDPDALDFSNKGYLIGGGGDGAGPGMKLRKDFPGTAAWFPKLRTDAAGTTRVRITAPDALTRYRLVAVAHAGRSGFGSAESSFTTRQPLMIMPGLGQHANVGDLITARAVIRNESGNDGSLEVSLTLDDTAEAANQGKLRHQLHLKNGTSAAVDFPVRAIAMGDARWTWSARLDSGGGTLTDETVSSLIVGSAAPVLRETYLTETAADESTDLLAGVNPQLLEGSGGVSITLSNTRLATLRESATYLMEYPYGCAEQVVSGLIPLILLNELKPVMPQLAASAAEATAAVQQGLDRLFAMQTADGGIAYWPGGNSSSLFASTYVALACLLAASNENIHIPAGRNSLLDFLSTQLRSDPTTLRHLAHDDRAFAVYTLAAWGRPEPAYHEELYQLRKELTGEARAWLALAIIHSNGPEQMVETLLDPKVTSPDAVSWFGGPARERAVQLFAWTTYRSKSREVARLVNELLKLRRNGHWGTTQQNAWALISLYHYYTTVEQGSHDVNAVLAANDREIPIELNRQTITTSHNFDIIPQNPPGPLTVSHRHGGKIFGETKFVVRPAHANQPAQNRGYAVSRTYQKINSDGKLGDASDLKVGDRLVVTLQVETARPGHFVAIDDPLPAILEAVNPTLQSRAVGGIVQDHDRVSDHRETRADRVLYFCDHLAPGSYTFRYLARVRMAGTVNAGPTKVEEMYRPERFGLGESTTLASEAAIE